MLDVHQEIEVAKEIRTQQRLVHICDDELPRVTAIVELQREFAFAKCADGSAVSRPQLQITRSRTGDMRKPVGKAGWHHTQSGPGIDEETTPG